MYNIFSISTDKVYLHLWYIDPHLKILTITFNNTFYAYGILRACVDATLNCLMKQMLFSLPCSCKLWWVLHFLSLLVCTLHPHPCPHLQTFVFSITPEWYYIYFSSLSQYQHIHGKCVLANHHSVPILPVCKFFTNIFIGTVATFQIVLFTKSAPVH